MSWLARSIANSLRIDDDDNPNSDHSPSPSDRHPAEDAAEDGGDIRGVKEDLTELKHSLTRQLWGVANFLAPPPPPPTAEAAYVQRVESEFNKPESVYDDGDEEDDKLGDVKEEEEENEIHDYSNCDKYVDEDEDEEWMREVAGLTEEVLTFARDIAHHPETWLDFPLDDDDDDDFHNFPMSEPQKRHTQAIEHLTPRLAALRIELCPAHMSVGFFWKVYFVLVHSRLNKQDAELLSTPEVVEARVKWIQELHKRAKKESERFYGGHYGGHYGGADFDEDLTPRSLQNEHSETMSSWTFASEPTTSSTTADSDTEKQVNTEMQFTDKSVTDENPLTETDGKNTHPAPVYMRPALKFDDDDDDWPEDDCLGHNEKVIPVGIDEDISFSDLEDDDCCIPIISKPDFEV